MGRFVFRRTLSMIGVLFAISVLTFLIFTRDPPTRALRLAGRFPTPATLAHIRHQWGFDQPMYVQLPADMKLIFTGQVISYTQQVNVVHQIWAYLPVTLSLAIGAGIIWLSMGILFGLLSAWRAGRWLDRGLTVLSMIGVSMPVFFLGAVLSYYIGVKLGWLPPGGYVKFTTSPMGVVQAPDHAVVRAVGAVHRRVLARPALHDPRHGQRRLRQDGEGQGAERAPGDDPPRPAQQHDPDHHAVRARLRRGDRRRSDPDRDRLQPARGRVSTPPSRCRRSTSRRCW